MFNIDDLISDCLEAVNDSPGHSGVAVEEVLNRTISDPNAIESAIGHPRDQPSMTTWYRSQEMTVLHMVWPPTVSLTAHDHLMWAAIGIYGGREDNDLFRSLDDGTLEHRKSASLRRGDTILLGDDAIHSVTNPSREWTGAIHVYGGDWFRPDKKIWREPTNTSESFDSEFVRVVLQDAAKCAKAEEVAGSSEP